MKQKLILKSSNKGYLQIDFIFTLIAFLFLFTLIYGLYTQEKTSILNTNEELKLQSSAQDICILLTSSQGIPNNWESDINNIQSISLKNISSQNLSQTKIDKLKTVSYKDLKKILEIKDNIHIKIIGLATNTNYLSYGINIENFNDILYKKYNCYSNLNNEIVKISITRWK